MSHLLSNPVSVRPPSSPVFIRRIMGLETEYGITATIEGHRKLSADEIARLLFAPIVDRYRSSNIYTDNASRLYLDVGAHPEYATAECDSLHQLLAYDRAGDMMIHALADQCEQELLSQGKKASVYLLKNNTDSHGNSYGCHENYLISRHISLKHLSQQFLPFLITRQLICGAGCIAFSEEGEAEFRLSQRAEHMWEGVSSATTRSRPMINTRDEPHADSSRYRRLHVIVGDSTMSEQTTALKIGSALLVLEILEAGGKNGITVPDLEVANESMAIRDTARDLTGKTPIRLRSGGVLSALDIQRTFLEAAQRWLEQRPEPDYDPERGFLGTPSTQLRPVVELWARTLDALEAEDYSSINKDIDWAIKKELLEQFRRRDNREWNDPRLAQIDLLYHDIHPQRGIFHLLENKGTATKILAPEDICRAQNQAPTTTRAALRGEFMRRARAADIPMTVDWMRLKVNGERGYEQVLDDPFDYHISTIGSLLEHVDKVIEEKSRG